MQAYTDAPQVYKSDVPPPVPTYRWSYEQRVAASKRQTRAEGKHKGRARRHLRETQTRQLLNRRQAIRTEPLVFRGPDGQTITLDELLTAPLDGRQGPVVAHRRRAKELRDLIDRHGPASGWGIPQPPEDETWNERWTPYMVPKAAEACWRWWRSKLRALGRILRGLAWLWWKAVPSHRSLLLQEGTEEARRGGRGSVPQPLNGVQGPLRMPWETLATRSPHLFAM